MEQKWNIPIDSCRFFDPFFEIPFLLPLPRETRGGGERGGNCKRRRQLALEARRDNNVARYRVETRRRRCRR